jgi:hypothetical protein
MQQLLQPNVYTVLLIAWYHRRLEMAAVRLDSDVMPGARLGRVAERLQRYTVATHIPVAAFAAQPELAADTSHAHVARMPRSEQAFFAQVAAGAGNRRAVAGCAAAAMLLFLRKALQRMMLWLLSNAASPWLIKQQIPVRMLRRMPQQRASCVNNAWHAQPHFMLM